MPSDRGERTWTDGESYPSDWWHATIHLHPESGSMHSDGDHRVRTWLEERISGERPPKAWTENYARKLTEVMEKRHAAESRLRQVEADLKEARRLLRNLTDPNPGGWQEALQEARAVIGDP